MKIKDFPGGTVDKNSPANAGNTSLIPGPGRFHMPWNNLSSCATATGCKCITPGRTHKELIIAVKSGRKTGWNRNQKDGLPFFVCFLFVSFECEPNAHLQRMNNFTEGKKSKGFV